MNNTLARLLFVSILFLGFLPVSASEITVATFNLHKLGETDNPEQLAKIADICRGLDILAIQEVHPDGAHAIEVLAGLMGGEYNSSVSEVTTWERFAFIYRPPVLLLEPASLMTELKLGRKPYRGVFRAGNFDFELINVHLFWDGSKKTYPHTRSVEIKLLDDWLCYREDEELDVILIGDFNSPNTYYRNQMPPVMTSHYAFYELLNRHGMVSVSVEKGIPTSIANRNIYDHLIFNPSHNFVEEFVGFDSVNVLKWEMPWDKDKDGKLNWSEHVAASSEVTDHRMVSARFRTDLPDDDEEEKQSLPPANHSGTIN